MIDTVAGAKQVRWFTALLKLQRRITLSLIVSSIFWKKSLDTWMTMVWISVKICFLGQTSCHRNAENNFNDMLLFGAAAYVGIPTMERLRWKRYVHTDEAKFAVRWCTIVINQNSIILETIFWIIGEECGKSLDSDCIYFYKVVI